MNKNVYTKIFLKQLGKSINDASVKESIHTWWKNTRNKDTGGLRLTDEGLEVIQTLEIATYDIPFPRDMRLTAQTVIFLDQFIDCPYYLTDRNIIVTNEKKAVELTLFSGDVRKYGITKAMKKQKNED